jgi:hypothetical protein
MHRESMAHGPTPSNGWAVGRTLAIAGLWAVTWPGTASGRPGTALQLSPHKHPPNETSPFTVTPPSPAQSSRALPAAPPFAAPRFNVSDPHA